ncbi:hypothetical protein B0A49_04283, partial [Cryomyces minteri]
QRYNASVKRKQKLKPRLGEQALFLSVAHSSVQLHQNVLTAAIPAARPVSPWQETSPPGANAKLLAKLPKQTARLLRPNLKVRQPPRQPLHQQTSVSLPRRQHCPSALAMCLLT